MLQNLVKRYNSKTPEKFIKLGRAITRLGHTLQLTLATIEFAAQVLSPKTYLIVMITIAVIQWLGSEVVNFFTEESTPQEP